MNAAPLINRAISSANPNRSSTESLEARVTRLETLIQQRPVRAMAAPAPKPAAVKTYPKLDVDEIKREADRRVAAMRAAELKILNRVSGKI